MFKKIHDPITYRHPRSLNEAFPGTADYANAFEGHVEMHAMPKADRVVLIACAIAAAVVAVLAVLRALPGGGA
jgi:hypothetical protein